MAYPTMPRNIVSTKNTNTSTRTETVRRTGIRTVTEIKTAIKAPTRTRIGKKTGTGTRTEIDLVTRVHTRTRSTKTKNMVRNIAIVTKKRTDIETLIGRNRSTGTR